MKKDLKNTDSKTNVAILYHYIAHYRMPIFSLLNSGSSGPDYDIYAAKERNESSIKIVTGSEGSDQPIKIHPVKNYWFGRHFLWQAGAIRLALNKKYDAVIYLGNMLFLSTWVSVILAKLAGKRTFMWTHGLRKKETGLKWFMRSLFYKLADGLLLYGERAKGLLLESGFDENKLYVIYNSLDYASQVNIRDNCKAVNLDKLGYDFSHKDCPVIISMGRLTYAKRLDLLLEAVARLKLQGVDANLLIVGGGPEKTRLHNLSAQYELNDRVIFTGDCYDEARLGPLIMRADLCVIPGDIGLSAIHSMVYETPVITHDNLDTQKPEHEAIIEGVTGGYFKEGDVADLVNVLTSWFTKIKQNPAEIAKQCRLVIESKYNPCHQKMLIDRAVLS